MTTPHHRTETGRASLVHASLAHASLALVCALAAGLCPGRAQAQFAERLAVHGELGFGSMFPDFQRSNLGYDGDYQGTLRVALTVFDPVAVQVSAGYWYFPSDNGFGSVIPVTGGVRVEPRVGRLGRLFVDGNLGVAFTGDETRLGLDLGLGFEFRLAPAVSVGPLVRYDRVFAASTNFPSDAQYWSAGISLGLRAPPAEQPVALDRDHDGVLDPADQCPDTPQGDHPDPQRPGCPLDDRDHDGVLDPADQCPDTPQGDHPDPQRPGCPLGDRDHDGVLDPMDQCPDTPQGDRPDPRRPGCPLADTDGDGVYDDADQCVTVPAGLHPDPARPGCPLPDRDRDTVPDHGDACPDLPGAPSTDPARNGCPGLVRMDEGAIHIVRPVFFAVDRDVILPTSEGVLAAVADALRATPMIRRMSVEGHTDDMATLEHNMDLSNRRAANVMRWLVEHGIEAGRLEAHGFGPTRPVSPTAGLRGRALREARARNRRVEFNITDPAPRPPASAAPASPPAANPPPAPPPAPPSADGSGHHHHHHHEH